jgi:hypothetical protein
MRASLHVERLHRSMEAKDFGYGGGIGGLVGRGQERGRLKCG